MYFVGILGFVFTEDIPTGTDGNGTVPKQPVAANKTGNVDISGNHEHVPALVCRLACGDQRAAFSGASTTRTPQLRPLMIRLRLGKFHFTGGVPGANSLMIQP